MRKEPEKRDFVTISRAASDGLPAIPEEKPCIEDYEILNRLAGGGAWEQSGGLSKSVPTAKWP
jgi:hypothetical protein